MSVRSVRLDSLTVGRAFFLRPAQDEWNATPGIPGGPLADPRFVFKIETLAETVDVLSAAGARTSLAPETLVVEVPRAGWDRLAKR